VPRVYIVQGIKQVPVERTAPREHLPQNSCTSQRVKNMGLKGMKEPLLPEPCAPELPTDEAAYAAAAAESRPPPFNPCHNGDDEFESVPMARTRAPERSRCGRRPASHPHYAHRLLLSVCACSSCLRATRPPVCGAIAIAR
jgi:hypothetical protein